MKKLLIGFIAGAAVVGFSMLFSGCNHHDRTKARIYFVDLEPTDEETEPCEVEDCSDTCEIEHEHHHGHHGHHDNGNDDNDD